MLKSVSDPLRAKTLRYHAENIMLGNQIGEDKGKVTGQRVLDANGPKIEVSFSATGRYVGIDITNAVTYWSIPVAANVLYGEGQGLIMRTNNVDAIGWTGQGIGNFTTPGKVRFRGSVFFKTSLSATLSALNNMVAVFEYESDSGGNTSTKLWEWK
jgi:hypothetical protein